MLNFEQKRQT